MTETKKCGACHITKPLNAYSRDTTRRDGVKPQCRTCVSDLRRRPRPTAAPATAGRWFVVESDGTTFLVRNIRDYEVIVEFDGRDWVCSECASPGPRTLTRCAHIEACGRALPRDLAVKLAGRITPTSRSTPTVPTSAPAARAPRKTSAEIQAAGAARRAERNAEHDAQHAQFTSTVTVRRATPEDMERLAAAKARKAGRYQPGDKRMV